ncbi:MAG: hypothetical protein A2V65_04675 [Deltaproteobacteria bacterium RBG_13_49_15]|nr:MAG: hypothetical protein A2V65_04675 [Deltaproteobacteria bacterium RBG_13_49_15]
MNIDRKKIAAIILAAGLGKRMKSKKAKVLHEILGKPMVMYVVEAAKQVVGENIVVVVGNQAEEVRNTILKYTFAVFAVQEAQLGTGHAVLSAMPYLPQETEHVIIMCGDVPLLRAETMEALLEDHIRENRDLSLLGAQLETPAGYGRILFDGEGSLSRIIEEADATEKQRKINVVNAGTYCARRSFLSETLGKIRTDNVQGEFYFTDIIQIAYCDRKRIGAVIGCDPIEVIGINTYRELEVVEGVMKKKLIKNLT